MNEPSAIVTALTTIASNATSIIESVVPIAIGIMGIFLVWKLGIKMFKSIASK